MALCATLCVLWLRSKCKTADRGYALADGAALGVAYRAVGQIVNTTFSNNHADLMAGGMFSDSRRVDVVGCMFAGNTAVWGALPLMPCARSADRAVPVANQLRACGCALTADRRRPRNRCHQHSAGGATVQAVDARV